MTDNDATAEVTRGTRWLRFFGVFVIGLLAAGVLTVGIAQGGLAASFTVSGSQFKTSAGNVRGNGFVQYGSVDQSATGAHPVATNGFKSAEIDDFCQSAVIPGVPGIGDMSIKLQAGGHNGLKASNLILNLSGLQGDFQLNNAQIGVDASHLDRGPKGATGIPGTFGLQGDSAQLHNVKQTAWSTTASTLKLTGLNMSVSAGKDECF